MQEKSFSAWSFSARVQDADVARICKEAKEEGASVVEVTIGTHSAMVFVTMSLLAYINTWTDADLSWGPVYRLAPNAGSFREMTCGVDI